MPLFKPDDVNTPVLSQFSLKGKVAAVTGGARGIGLEVVRGLAEAGADVALIYNTSKNGPEIATQIAKETGVIVRAYQSNVIPREMIANTINKIADDFGRLDIVVANAGVCANIPNLDYTEETWQYNNSVNFDGVMWTAQAAGKIFKRQGKGNLIITASVSATLVNIPQRQAAYNASKAAAVHLGKSLAVEWVDFARVNCISPGYIDTNSNYPRKRVLSVQTNNPLVLRMQPPELFDKWLSMVPGNRLCDAAELKSVSKDLFLSSRVALTPTGIRLPGKRCL
jgi:sorbose reductase